MKLEWQQAPVKTLWGDDMVVASVAIDKDHTLSLYCERDQAPKVETIFAQTAQRKPLTDDEIWKFWWSRPEVPEGEDDSMEAEFVAAVRRVLAAHGIKENT